MEAQSTSLGQTLQPLGTILKAVMEWMALPKTQDQYILWPGEPVSDVKFLPPTEFCKICKDKIVIQIFKGTGVCCELCRKVDIGEVGHIEWAERMDQRDARQNR
jgi:hypothetical protein